MRTLDRTVVTCIFVLTGCDPGGLGPRSMHGSAQRPSDEADAASFTGDARSRVGLMRDLAPVIREVGEPGVVPAFVAIEFDRGMVASAEAPVHERTRVVIEPAVDGALSWTSPSTLTWQPSSPLRPSTEYTIRLEAVGVDDTVVSAPAGGWTHRFTTPRFAFVRADLERFEPAKHRALVRIVFSSPVDVASVGARARFSLSDGALAPRFEATERPNIVRATITDRRLRDGVAIGYEQDIGIPATHDRDALASPASHAIELPIGMPVHILAARPKEGANGFFVHVVCDDDAVKAEISYWDPDTRQYFRTSSRCVLDEKEAASFVRFEPKVKFSVSPTRGGFKLLGDFRRGSYSMAIDHGIRYL